jgi:four helix bundle protein
MIIQTAKDLEVYKLAYDLAMRIFGASRRFPAEERWALTGQIRRSSRSVCLNLREAWAKRRYEAHFTSKLTDCDGENNETDTSLDFARDCDYITLAEYKEMTLLNRSIGRMLGAMIKNPTPFLIKEEKSRRTDARRPATALRPPPSVNGLIKPDTGRIEMRGRVGALIALGAGFKPGFDPKKSSRHLTSWVSITIWNSPL